MSKNNMYSLVLSTIEGLEVGETAEIKLPENIKYFRRYLCEISKRQDKKFTTKIIGGKLHIFRVKYSNIYSRELE